MNDRRHVTGVLVHLASPALCFWRSKAYGGVISGFESLAIGDAVGCGVYEQTRCFPKHEIYRLASQMRRAAVSIPSDIAEGKGRSSDRDRAHFLCHARGSLLELETQIFIAQQLEYLCDSESEKLIANATQFRRMLNALIQSQQDLEHPGQSVA